MVEDVGFSGTCRNSRMKRCQRQSEFEGFLVASVEDIDYLCRYRHAAPSAPWPWMDFNQDVADVPPLSPGAHEPWARYPQSHFGNWTPEQVQRCRMLSICKDQYACQIHKVDVFKDGIFVRPDEDTRTREIPSDPTSAKEFWDDIQSPVSASRFTPCRRYESEVFNSEIRTFASEPFSSRTSP
jgi:hypothetical protein